MLEILRLCDGHEPLKVTDYDLELKFFQNIHAGLNSHLMVLLEVDGKFKSIHRLGEVGCREHAYEEYIGTLVLSFMSTSTLLSVEHMELWSTLFPTMVFCIDARPE